ncbi:putative DIHYDROLIPOAMIDE S-ACETYLTRANSFERASE E2 COMPONENT PDHC [Mycobacterium xenopi 3993]|nr:putative DIHYDROLIPOAMIDE S-ACETYLTRANSFERASE E2 COMPONENT PDHC [Mycobacterium xenopi 3993]
MPVRGVHAEMARRMIVSRKEIPDAHASVHVECTNLQRACDRLGVTPFVLTLRFVVIALTHHKILNSTWVDGADGPQVHTHHAIHLGFAVAAPVVCWYRSSPMRSARPPGSSPTVSSG